MQNTCNLRRALLFVDFAPVGPYPAPGPGVLDPEGGLVGGYLFMECRLSYNTTEDISHIYTWMATIAPNLTLETLIELDLNHLETNYILIHGTFK